jgi:hypothetical protein
MVLSNNDRYEVRSGKSMPEVFKVPIEPMPYLAYPHKSSRVGRSLWKAASSNILDDHKQWTIWRTRLRSSKLRTEASPYTRTISF